MGALVKEVDGILLVTDNTISSAIKLVGDIALEANLPVVGASVEVIEVNGLATYGLDYYELGKQTARMLVKHIETQQPLSTTPVELAEELNLVVNEDFAKALGIDPKTIRISE